MDISNQEFPHREGDIINQIKKETIYKPKKKWRDKLSFFHKKKPNDDKENEGNKIFKGEERDDESPLDELSNLQINFDELIDERNKLLSELQNDDIDGTNLVGKEKSTSLDNKYKQMILEMAAEDEKTGENRLLRKIYPEIISRVDSKTNFFALHKELGLFPLVLEGVNEGNPTEIGDINIRWKQELQPGTAGVYVSASSWEDFVDYYNKSHGKNDKSDFLSKLKIVHQYNAPKRETRIIKVPTKNEGENFKKTILFSLITNYQTSSLDEVLIHELLHSTQIPEAYIYDMYMLYVIGQKMQSKEPASNIVKASIGIIALTIKLKDPALTNKLFQMLKTERPALEEAHARQKNISRGAHKIPTPEEKRYEVEEARNINSEDIYSNPDYIQVNEYIEKLTNNSYDNVSFQNPDGSVVSISLKDPQNRKKMIDYVEELRNRLVGELYSRAPRVYERINPEHFMYAVHAVSRLEALGVSSTQIGELIKYDKGWNEETKTFPNIEDAIEQRRTRLNLTEDDVENLIIARRLEKEIDAYRAEKIARDEIKKFYSEYYAQK